jgi:hypothetical protein
LLLVLKERHWRQCDAIPDGPFKDVAEEGTIGITFNALPAMGVLF